MSRRLPLCTLLVPATAAALATLVACTGGKAPAPSPPQPPAPAPAPAAVTPAAPEPELTQEQMMAAWMAAMTPGEFHARLEPMVGTFDAVTSSWMSEGAPPETGGGTSVNQWILGNRYLEQKFTGSFMGNPFEGQGITGYDNVQKQYVGSWIDNMGTGLVTMAGEVDAAGTTFTFRGEMLDPATGKPVPLREVVVVQGPDKHVFTMFGVDQPGASERKMMEIVYTRAAPRK